MGRGVRAGIAHEVPWASRAICLGTSHAAGSLELGKRLQVTTSLKDSSWGSRGLYHRHDIEEVEEEIHDCIRIAHPGFHRASLPEFIDSVDEVGSGEFGRV